MKRQLFIVLLAFIISCNKKDDLLAKDKLIEKQKKIKFVDTISGIYKTEFDSTSDCPITLKISNRNGKYYYNLETSKRNLKGKIYFINDGSDIVLEGIRWDKHVGQIKKESGNEESIEDENEKDNPIGIPFLIFKDRLKLQNTGMTTNTRNSKNYHYQVIGECEAKYVQLTKK